MKKLFTLLTLLLCVASSAWAQTYTDESSTVTYAFTSHESLGSVNSPADAFLATNFTYGSNLNLSTFNTKNCTAGWNEMTLVFFKPTTTVAKNAGEFSENMLEWTITPAQGIVFTPTDVSLTACTAGGTGDPQISIYAVYSDNTEETIQTKTNPNRPDKTGTDAPSTYTKTLASAVSGKFVVRAYFQGLTNTGKGAAITNVVISGKVSGTPVATTTYTITVATNDATLGSVSGTSTVAENEEVTITATPTAAGYFTKWLKDNADFDGNTVNPLTVTATADATYTAIFESKKIISFAAGEGMGIVPSTVYLMSGEDYTIPESYFLYKSGATLTGWNDGTTTHEIGATLSNVTADMVLTAQFTDNTVNLGDAETTVNWTFARDNGAPTLTCENSEMDYVQHTTINNTRYDVVMHVDTRKDQVIDGKTGKLNNTSDASRAQVNMGTKFTVPVIDGSVISYTKTNGTLEASSVTFGGNNGIVSDNVISYTYSGDAGTLDVIDVTGGFYPSGISVKYPYAGIPGPADPENMILLATISNETGTISSNTWTMTDNNNYTFSASSLSWKSGTTDFKIAKDGTYTIKVPSDVKVTKIDINGYSSSTDGTTLTLGNENHLYKTAEVYSFTPSHSTGADIVFTTSGKEMEISYIKLYSADGLTLTTTASMQGWRSFYDADNSYTLDDKTKAYVVTKVEQDESIMTYVAMEAVLTEISAVPAATPVLLKTSNQETTSTDGHYSMTLKKAENVQGLDIINLLKATPYAGNWYRLGSKDGEIGFFPYDATNAAAGIVVLNYDSSNAQGARGLTLSFADDETTAISNVIDNVNLNKVIFDLQGRRVAQPAKGLYIVNGKKVVIK